MHADLWSASEDLDDSGSVDLDEFVTVQASVGAVCELLKLSSGSPPEGNGRLLTLEGQYAVLHLSYVFGTCRQTGVEH